MICPFLGITECTSPRLPRSLPAITAKRAAPDAATGARRGAPRVGDGLIRVDPDGVVTYASPNAVSAYHRIGMQGELVGTSLAAVTAGLLDPGSQSFQRTLENKSGIEMVRRIPPANPRLSPPLQTWPLMISFREADAYGYEDQDAYLRSLGKNDTFLDYEGHGELNLVLTDILIKGEWGNRLDVTSRIGGKENVEIQYQQRTPWFNFSPYIQYWYGYNETLLRFDKFGKRTFFGVAFEY